MSERTPIRRTASLLLLLPLVFLVTVPARPAEGQDIFTPPPADKFSTITLQDFSLLDTGFADMIRGTIVDGQGNSNVKNATFFFQQCFGGGFLDNLNTALPSDLDFVAGAA